LGGRLHETIGYALPFAHGVDVAVILPSGASFADIKDNMYIIVIYAVILFILAIVSFSSKMKKIKLAF
jgi:hypothetical protein